MTRRTRYFGLCNAQELLSTQVDIRPYLMNLYSQVLPKLQESQESLQNRQKEIQGLNALKAAYKSGATKSSDYDQIYLVISFAYDDTLVMV